ncbi:repeat element protein-d7.1 [Ichnoviriform fugitivi]|uniref:Repeat element protein-d7.1 n=1 Tax=Ichnoviriform fugitivi TaxID=265522 RepID=A2Q0L3_9VIRU|nr:repeat element protein-d7.1 [Ichnoviriform fugitivi]BAF45728.1 repeat element protein-d7.1 [Ichnoviriform fugitivi]
MSELPGAAESESPEISGPMDSILHMADQLNLADYPVVVQSISTDGNENPSAPVNMLNLWNHEFRATFLNGKHVDIEYNFDAKRKEEDRVLINMNDLRPIFGGKLPPTKDQFASIFELYEFVKEEVQLDECSDYQHAACPCNLECAGEEFYGASEKPVVDECENKHFHHYCWEHILSWLINYLYTTILLLESEELFKEEIAEQYARFPEDIPYFQTGKRATPEFFLKCAHEIDMAIYEDEGAPNQIHIRNRNKRAG